MVADFRRPQDSRIPYHAYGHTHYAPKRKWPCHWTSTDQDGSYELELQWIGPSGSWLPASTRFQKPLCLWACPLYPHGQMIITLHIYRPKQFQWIWFGVNRPSGCWVMATANFAGRTDGRMNERRRAFHSPPFFLRKGRENGDNDTYLITREPNLATASAGNNIIQSILTAWWISRPLFHFNRFCLIWVLLIMHRACGDKLSLKLWTSTYTHRNVSNVKSNQAFYFPNRNTTVVYEIHNKIICKVITYLSHVHISTMLTG